MKTFFNVKQMLHPQIQLALLGPGFGRNVTLSLIMFQLQSRFVANYCKQYESLRVLL